MLDKSGFTELVKSFPADKTPTARAAVLEVFVGHKIACFKPFSDDIILKAIVINPYPVAPFLRDEETDLDQFRVGVLNEDETAIDHVTHWIPIADVIEILDDDLHKGQRMLKAFWQTVLDERKGA